MSFRFSSKLLLSLVIIFSYIVPFGTAFAAQSVMPAPANIFITNNLAPTADSVQITGLAVGDVVKVYPDSSSSTVLATGTVSAGTGITLSVAQLGTSAGTCFITVTSPSYSESYRAAKYFQGEPVTAPFAPGNISITNNVAGTADTVTVQGLAVGDVVKVYTDTITPTAIATGTVPAGNAKVTVSIPQIGTAAGSLYITVTTAGKGESGRVYKSFAKEPASTAPNVGNIKVVNNMAGTADTITISRVTVGDIVKVYTDQVNPTPIVQGTVASGNVLTLSYTQLGIIDGSVFVTITSPSKAESQRIEKVYSAEPTSTALSPANIIIQHTPGSASASVLVKELVAGTIVKIYSDNSTTTSMASGTVAAGGNSVLINVGSLGTSGGTLYVTITAPGGYESARTSKLFDADPTTDMLTPGQITITNNLTGTADTIKVTGLSAGDVVSLYNGQYDASAIATATVPAGSTIATLTVADLGEGAGVVYLAAKHGSLAEGSRTAKSYSAQVSTAPANVSNISITNNVVGTSDVVHVTGIAAGSTVNIYTDPVTTTVFASGVVPAGNNSLDISIPQIGGTSGYIYVTVKGPGMVESRRIGKAYSSENGTSQPDRNNIVVSHNVGIPSTVTVGGLTAGDVVKVFGDSAATELLGSSTVAAGAFNVTIPVGTLPEGYGVIYVTVKRGAMQESRVTAKVYGAQAQTTQPSVANTIVKNNVGVTDTVTVTGLTAGDVVKVYSSVASTTAIGTATVAAGAINVTINISQLGVDSTYIYVTNTSSGKLESIRAKIFVPAE